MGGTEGGNVPLLAKRKEDKQKECKSKLRQIPKCEEGKRKREKWGKQILRVVCGDIIILKV